MSLGPVDRFSTVETMINDWRVDGFIFPNTEDVTAACVLEYITLSNYLFDNNRELINDVTFGTGLYESECITDWFALNDEAPPEQLTEPVTIGEVVKGVSLAMRFSMSIMRQHKDLLYRYAVYLDLTRELQRLCLDMYPNTINNPTLVGNDHMGTSMQALATIVQMQNRDYKEPPLVRYNDVTRRLELVYTMHAEDVVDLLVSRGLYKP